MDFSFTEAQHELAGLTRHIVTDLVTPQTLGPHGSGGHDSALWTAMAKAGLLDAALPNAVGGGGYGLLEQCSTLTELGRAVAPVPYLPTITVAASVLAEHADPMLVERWILPAVRGEAVIAAAVPDAGAPAEWTVRRDQENWLISGAQTAVPFGAFADGFLVLARTDSGQEAVVLVDLADAEAELTVSPQRTVDNADAAMVTAEDARAAAVFGGDAARTLRLRATAGLCAWQLGVLERAVELTAAYARERTQFGKPIGGFQAVRHRLADAHLDVEAVRLSLWQAAWQLEADPANAAAAVATAKYWAAEAGHRVAHTAVHVHGGVGIDVDHPLHRYYVAATRAEFTFGGATAQLRTLGDLLSH
ncbi:acyl-CoA dehydrogenase [Prauserella marina]|uniref:Acyl-CoA dehydrogenase n=1 Tax=Prauserella marina TaxID=530584 RepID=A0A222VU44_9PSEU|nr:acyl-CoA dehydrogenase family protein [Prauserella marina]ASR37466.1 acyl-CoA dehydrogenase [Prauserella marina]PWV74645.1 alkylation response protein AidB-like acyl-CoA dehydrogenase [Prauserella marina]SDD44443.1 Acyl-CoA dehydrogenase [Prauserella marina]